MTEEIINTDDYFFEITDEGRGTIDYGCVSYKTVELVRRIHKQNKQLQRLKQENEKLKENLDDLTKDLKVQNDIIGKFETALEEINTILNDAYRTGRRTLALAKIRDKIDEVLGE